MNHEKTESAALRRRAEEHLQTGALSDQAGYDSADTLKLLHELSVHQVELQMQNEELREAKDEADTWLNLYTELFDFAPAGYFSLDANGVICQVNLEGSRLLGMERSSLVGTLFEGFVSAEHISLFRSLMVDIAETQLKQSREVVLSPADGGRVDVRLDAVCGNNGLNYRIAAIDISERKKAEQMLKRIEWMLTKTPQSLTDDDQEQLLYAPPALQNGVVMQTMGQQGLVSIIHEASELLRSSATVFERNGDCAFMMLTSEWCRLMNSSTTAGQPTVEPGKLNACHSCARKDGLNAMSLAAPTESICACGLHLYCVPIMASGDVAGVVTVTYGDPPSDPAIQNKLASEYQVSLVDIKHAASVYDTRPLYIIEIAKHRLQTSALLIGSMIEASCSKHQQEMLEVQLRQSQIMEAVGRLAGGVAHDYNNMLTTILGYAELALGELPPTHPLSTSLREIVTAGQRSADLTNQLLAFASSQPIMPKDVDINEAIANLTSTLRRMIDPGIDLCYKPCREPLWVHMDTAQIDQIMSNLVLNAKEAIHGHGHIIVETSSHVIDSSYNQYHSEVKQGRYVLIQVSDNGCGMDKDTLNNLFEPFFTTKRFGQGAGLGLATVYGIVRQNSGIINASSEPGLGTTIKVYLPQNANVQVQAVIGTDGQTEPANLATVLLVENEPSVLRYTEMVLTRFGYTVLSALQPLQAISIAKEHQGEIQLLITDVVMPEMNGTALAETIRGLRPDIKTVFMSGYTSDVMRDHGDPGDNLFFVQKPFSRGELAIVVQDALKQR
ncbi:MAG: ATP-binding protein [Armatimonadota bacterium]